MLAVEPAEQGYKASYIYWDEETRYIARDQMKLLEGRLPQKAVSYTHLDVYKRQMLVP